MKTEIKKVDSDLETQFLAKACDDSGFAIAYAILQLANKINEITDKIDDVAIAIELAGREIETAGRRMAQDTPLNFSLIDAATVLAKAIEASRP